MIDKITEQKIKDSASITDVVGEFTRLRKKGENFIGLCPLHDDRSVGSFIVNPRKNICKCFSCSDKAMNPVDFLMKKEGLRYNEALMWLAQRYGIDCEGAEKYEGITYEKRQAAAPKALLEIPVKWMAATMKDVADNLLIKWLHSLPWDNEQKSIMEELIRLYCVGTFKKGHTMFWQIDENKKVRTGKMMLYKPDGHRDKDSEYNFDWIHSYLARPFEYVEGLKVAKKVFYDADRLDYKSCYFGMHLVSAFPNATINIVESEKTALICSIYYGTPDEFLWLACGGKSNISEWKMAPLISAGRHVVLYPDKDGEQEWIEQAKKVGYDRLTVNTEFMRKHWKPEDGEKADIADILVRMMKEIPPTFDELCEKHPQLEPLKKLDLEVVGYSKVQNNQQFENND